MARPSPNKTDLRPGARITVEIEPPKYVAGVDSYILQKPGSYLTIEDFTSISTVHGLSGSPQATITLASHRDYWFRSARMRPRGTRRQQEISEYLAEVLGLVTMTELNPRRRPMQQDDIRFLGVPLKKLGRRLETFLSRLYFNETDAGLRSPAAPPRSRLDEYQSFEWYPAELEEMRRVWVDFLDRDGRWIAAFTGIISDVQDSVSAGQPPMLTLTCSGMMRFWEMSEYITRQALRNLEWPFPGGATEFTQSTMSNSLAGWDGTDIMVEMARSVNEWFAYTGDPIDQLEPRPLKRNPEDYFHHAMLLDYKATAAENATFGESGASINPVRETPVNPGTAPANGRLIIDPEIIRNDGRRAEVYRKAIRTAFDLYRFENTTPFRIASDVAAMTLFDFFEDPRGNILLWVPKYDALPRVRGEQGTPVEDMISLPPGTEIVPPFPAGTIGSSGGRTASTRFGEDYSTVPFHDASYIIDDVGLISWNLTRSEKAIKTFVRATSQPHGIQIGDTISAISNSGYTSSKEMEKISPDMANALVRLNRRYGIRRHTTPVLTTKSVGGETTMLTRFAYAVLLRTNAYAKAGSVSLVQRPEVWVGRSVFLAERQKLGYITRVQNVLNWRQSHQTVLTVAYVHDPAERIGQPWFERTSNEALGDPEDVQGILG